MELKQQLKLSQQLVMTPQLQQAIKLLQLSRLELTDLIRQEINENPVLDESLEAPSAEQQKDDGSDAGESDARQETSSDEQMDFDWRDYVDNTVKPSRTSFSWSDDIDHMEPVITERESFFDHLLWQLRLYDLTEQETQIGQYIIGNINKDGYLQTSSVEIAEELGLSVERIEEVRERIKKFDPVGAASFTLQECLLAQVEMLSVDCALAKTILQDHFNDLERKKYQAISKSLHISVREVYDACELIGSLEPRPGRSFSDKDPEYITPDIYVYKVGDEYAVVLNQDGQPKLKINSFYKNILSGSNVASDQTKEYIQEKLRSAVWLVKSVYHRQNTIVNVMKSIIKFQRDFFDYGTSHLKPLVLRDVAEDVGMHESNISRVTTNKYAHTPHGIFELKYFFNSGLASDEGGCIASERVKNRIKDIIQNEDPYKPCSDQEIARILKGEGINIARRTVTKYREMLRVLSSSKRKRHI